PDGGLVLRDADGRDVRLPEIPPRGQVFHRGKRLDVRRDFDRGFAVFSLDSRLTREYRPLEEGGPARLVGIRDVWGNRVDLRYEGDRLVAVADTAGRELLLEHDNSGRITLGSIRAAGKMHVVARYAYSVDG